MSVSYIDRQTLAALAPTVRDALHISHEQYGYVLAAFSLAYLVGAPLAGVLLDRTGARKGLVFSVLAWSAVAALHAVVPSLGALVGLRILLGLAEAPSFPGAVQTVQRALPRERRSAGVGLLFTGSSLGAMVAAPLAIYSRRAFGGWRPAFLGTALIGLLWVPVWLAVTGRPEVGQALTSDPPPPREPTDLPSRWSLLATPPVARAVLLVVFSAPVIMFGLNWWPQYLADAHGLSQDALATYVPLPPLFFDLGSILFGTLASHADRREGPHGPPSSRVVLMGIAALLGAALCLVPLAKGPWAATFLAAVALAGGGGIFALLTADMLARVHPSQVSTAGGITAAAQSIAYVIANPLVGRFVEVEHSYGVVLVALGVVVPPAMLVWAVWPMRSGKSAVDSRAWDSPSTPPARHPSSPPP
jgi:ACS family hexuronate transporter-like MFS transporter